MLNFLYLIILIPFFYIGWLIGFISRPFLQGWFYGFYTVEQTQRESLTDELLDIIQEEDVKNE